MEEPNLAQRARHVTGLTQEEFAESYRIPLPTVRKHEQGQRTPSGTAATLYQLIEQFPDELLKMLLKVPN